MLRVGECYGTETGLNSSKCAGKERDSSQKEKHGTNFLRRPFGNCFNCRCPFCLPSRVVAKCLCENETEKTWSFLRETPRTYLVRWKHHLFIHSKKKHITPRKARKSTVTWFLSTVLNLWFTFTKIFFCCFALSASKLNSSTLLLSHLGSQSSLFLLWQISLE